MTTRSKPSWGLDGKGEEITVYHVEPLELQGLFISAAITTLVRSEGFFVVAAVNWTLTIFFFWH